MSKSALLDAVLNGNDLEERQAYDLMQQFAAGDLEPAFAGALLAGLRAKGETAEEIRGFARAMRELAVRPEIPDGTLGVLLWVSDSGPGVPVEERRRVFEPFYTTKEPGYGTGLGLAIVQGTVHEMGGLAWVDEAREGGAAFKVFLPT